MPALARADLEVLLRSKKLDHTVAEPHNTIPRWGVPTGITELDTRLDGGFPRGHLSEIVGARSSGRFAVAVSTLASATRRGEAVALIDPVDMFDPPSAAVSGVDFSRVLWIRGEAVSAARVSLSSEYGTLQKSIDRAVKALNLVLQAGGFGLVVLDLAEISSQVLRRLPFTTWLRLQRVMEGSETACLLIGAEHVARSAGGVTLELDPRSLAQHALRARVIRARATETPHVCVPVSAAAC